jgi:DNA-directed RNA polymerase subunit RPC12/RpoP
MPTWEDRARKQVGCKHVWKDFIFNDKTPKGRHVQCIKCELVVRKEKIDNLTPFKCPECNSRVGYKEEMLELISARLIKCKNCDHVIKGEDIVNGAW